MNQTVKRTGLVTAVALLVLSLGYAGIVAVRADPEEPPIGRKTADSPVVQPDSGSPQSESELRESDTHPSIRNNMKALKLADAINETCPRSGKPVVANSLATYRGVTVGFCNQHCRDDFAGSIDDRPDDRKFFDDILAKRQ